MLKFMPVFTNRKDISRQRCLDHYRCRHGKLAASVPEFSRHMVKYVQNFLMEEDRDKGVAGSAYVGVSECWFYSLDAFWTAFAEPRYAELREDEKLFLDLDDLLLVAASPSHIFGPTEDCAVKLFRFMALDYTVDPAAAKIYWETGYSAAVRDDRRLRRVIRSYVQNRPMEGFVHNFPAAKGCDAADEFWFDHADALPDFFAAEAALRQRSGHDRHFDAARTIQFATTTKLLWDLGEDPAVGCFRVPLVGEG